MRPPAPTTTRGCTSHLAFDASGDVAAPFLTSRRPKVAILREQGVNTHVEMGYAMHRAGFDTFDVHMSDLQTGRARLDSSGLRRLRRLQLRRHARRRRGLGALDAVQPEARRAFASFFHRDDTFALGVCNGCQMMAALAPIIPGAEAWPQVHPQQERAVRGAPAMVEVLDSPSIFFTGMAGSRIPIAVAHGEGFADFSQRGDAAAVQRAMRFVDNHGRPTEAYPFNPNGSPDGLTAVTTADGRFTALMPHPERVFRNVQMSWTRGRTSRRSPWMRMFVNARRALG